MSQPLNSNQRQERLNQAIALAKKGKYQKASFLIKDMTDNPKARRLLEQMEGRRDKVEVTDFFSGTVLTMIAFAVIVFGLIVYVVLGVRAEFAARDAIYAEFPARGLEGNDELYYDLVLFCQDNLGTDSPGCLDWGAMVFTLHQQEIRSCVVVNDNGFNVDDDNRATITSCFSDVGIPDPY